MFGDVRKLCNYTLRYENGDELLNGLKHFPMRKGTKKNAQEKLTSVLGMKVQQGKSVIWLFLKIPL